MSKRRVPLGLKNRTPLAPKKESPISEESTIPAITKREEKVVVPQQKKPSKANTIKKGKGRPSTKQGKNLVKYSMDIHPELKRAVVKTAAINDKDVHVMWNEIIYDWFVKQKKVHPDWYTSIKVDKSEL